MACYPVGLAVLPALYMAAVGKTQVESEKKFVFLHLCHHRAHWRGEREREIWNTSSPGLYQIDNVIASSHICNTYICDEVFSEPPHVLNSYILSSMSALNILF